MKTLEAAAARCLALAALTLITIAPSWAVPCVVADSGSGKVDLPPAGCGDFNPADPLRITNDLPAGSPIVIGAELFAYFNVARSPGTMLDAFGAATTDTARMQTGEASVCPPIAAGIDIFPSTAKMVLQLDDGTEPFVVRLSSAGLPDTEIRRLEQAGSTIQTEILNLDLAGMHPRLGPVNLTLNPGTISAGEIRDVEQDPIGCALVGGDSFFDVFYAIDLPALGQTLFNIVPVRLEARLTALPPRDTQFEIPFLSPVVLYDGTNGQPVAQVLYDRHLADPPFPPAGTDCFQNVFSGMDLNLPSLGYPLIRIFAGGRVDVERGLPVPQPTGTIDTEIVQMDLSGMDPLLGRISVRLNPLQPTHGLIRSQQDDRTYPADSFFDLFLEIALVDQQLLLHNDQPVPLAAVSDIGVGNQNGIRNLPPDPDTDYRSPPGLPTPLVDATGLPVGDISNLDHFLQPPIDCQPPPPPEHHCQESRITIDIAPLGETCREVVTLPGSARILRTGPEDPGDGRDLMHALIARLVHAGPAIGACADLLGEMTLHVSPDQASEGEIRSLTPEENFPADSFFDVYYEIESATGTLHTAVPARLVTTINGVPPAAGEIYFGPGTAIPLLDAGGSPAGEMAIVSDQIERRISCTVQDFPQIGFIPDPAGPGHLLSVTIPHEGGGILYDVERANLSSPGSLSTATCLAPSSPGAGLPTGADPPPGEAVVFIARERYGAPPTGYLGTYNSGGPGQVADRDPLLTVPVPPNCP